MAEDLTLISDEELESRLQMLVAQERGKTIEVIALLAEMHRRHLDLRRGYSGLFYYCTRKLGYTPDQAMRRITVARLAVKCPALMPKLQARKIGVSSVRVLSPVLTTDNHEQLLDQAAGLPFHEVERLAANLNPQPAKRDHVQVVTEVGPLSTLDELPLFAQDRAPETRVHFSFTGSEELKLKLDRAKALLWHKFPQGRLEEIFEQALNDLLDKRDPGRRAAPPKPSPAGGTPSAHGRYIPTSVRADVWKRDGGRCAFTTCDGVRCRETGGLEYDHVVPFARGGVSDDPDNLRLLCRAHNQMMATDIFGEAAVRARQGPEQRPGA